MPFCYEAKRSMRIRRCRRKVIVGGWRMFRIKRMAIKSE